MAVRFGYAFDQLLFYGKAGGGWVGNNGLSVTNLTTGSPNAATAPAAGWSALAPSGRSRPIGR